NRRYSTHFIEARKVFSSCPTPLTIFYRVNVGPLDKDHWSYEMSEGGRIVGEGCHFIDALQYITDSLPKRVTISTVPTGGAVAHEENFSLTIEYENGSLGTIMYSALGNFRLPKEYIEIYGGGNIMVIDNFKSAKIIGPSKTRKLNLWHQDKGYARELEVMVNAIKNGWPSPMTPDELLASHLTTFKAMEAVKTGKAVELHFERENA
ncbi:MAG: Gfo/Idh/MocA family oxidoreductase, partial [Patescibacteria group bacterium]